MNKNNNKVISIFIAHTSAFLLLIYAPSALYMANIGEFFYDYNMLVKPLFFAYLICTALISGILVLLSRFPWYRILVVVSLIVILVTYVQGNFLTFWLPELMGQRINWNEYSIHRIICIALWAAISLIIFAIYKKLGVNRFYQVGQTILILLNCVLVVSFVLTGIVSNGFARKDIYSNTATTDGLMDISSKENFVMLVLDKVDAAEVKEVLMEDDYEGSFSDFTFYTNAETVFPYTHHSIPQILTGINFEKQSDFETYINSAYNESILLNTLKSEDYSLGIYETDLPITSDVLKNYVNMSECERKISSWPKFYKLQIMLVGYQYAPFDLKRFCYLLTNELDTLRVIPADKELFDMSNTFFYGRLCNESLNVVDNKVFRFIHIQGAHEWIYDENVNTIENGTYNQAVRASLLIAKEYLSQLKQQGVYDNTAIIIMADHGALDLMQQNPLFMVKGFGESHPEMIQNDAPVSYEDLPDAYMRILDGKSSEELFDYKEGDYRERKLLFQDNDNGNEKMIEYVQVGHAGDMDTLSIVNEF